MALNGVIPPAPLCVNGICRSGVNSPGLPFPLTGLLPVWPDGHRTAPRSVPSRIGLISERSGARASWWSRRPCPPVPPVVPAVPRRGRCRGLPGLPCRVLDRERGLLADRVRLDREVEVDADLLEEAVADGDEPDLDRDLQVLEPAELAEEVDDVVVDLRRVADDQADVQEERRDRADRLVGGVVAARRRPPPNPWTSPAPWP